MPSNAGSAESAPTVVNAADAGSANPVKAPAIRAGRTAMARATRHMGSGAATMADGAMKAAEAVEVAVPVAVGADVAVTAAVKAAVVAGTRTARASASARTTLTIIRGVNR